MIYTVIPARRAYYDDVVAFPEGDNLTATVRSDEVKSFETTAYGPVTVFLQGGGDTPNAHFMVSFDEGESWYEADEENFSDGFQTFEDVVKLAPRFRVDVDLNGQNISDADDWKVSVLTEELNPTVGRRTKTEEVGALASDESTYFVMDLGEATPQEFHAVVTNDNSEVTDATILLETSFDGENWWNLSDGTTDVDADVVTISNDDTNLFGKYVRVTVAAAADTGSVGEDAHLKVNAVAFVA